MESFRFSIGRSLLAILFFTLVCAGVFAPFLIQGRLLAPGDARVLSLPHYCASRTLWTPDIFCGFPVFADPQTFTFYPLAALLAWVPDSFNFFVLSALILAGWFTFGFVHRLTGSCTAGLLAGTVYALSGFSITHLGHTNMIHAACWLPLWLWGLESLRRAISPGGIAVSAGAVALSLFGGHPQITAYQLALGVIYALALGGPGWRPRCRFTAVTFASAALGLGLGAVLLLPMAELTAQSARTRMDFNDFVSLALPPNQWPQLLLPGIHGGLHDPFLGHQAATFGSGGGVLEATGYVGLLPCALALITMAAGTRRQPQVRFWSAVALVSLLLSFGKETPLASLTFHIPIWNRFRIPTRHLMEFTLAVAILAGFGLAELQRCEPRRRRRLIRNALLGLAGLVILAVTWFAGIAVAGLYTRHLAAVKLERINLSVLPWANASVAVPLVVLVVSAAALWLWGRRPGLLTAALLLGVFLLDLGMFAWLYLSPQLAIAAKPLCCPELLLAHARELHDSGQRLLPLDPYRLSGGAPPNLSRLWGLQSVSGYCPLLLRRYSELTGINYIGFDDYRFLDRESRVLDVLAARYVLAPAAWLDGSGRPPDPALPSALQDQSRFRRIAGMEDLTMFENLQAMPRAWLVSATLTLPPAEVCRTIRSGRLPSGEAFDPAALALVEEADSFRSENPDAAAHVRVVRDANSDVELETNSASAAFLVLSDADYPGWRADIDGRSACLVRTNHVQRGLIVPSGTHRVRFVYRPLSAVLGGVISGGCGLLTVAMLLLSLRRLSARPAVAQEPLLPPAALAA